MKSIFLSFVLGTLFLTSAFADGGVLPRNRPLAVALSRAPAQDFIIGAIDNGTNALPVDPRSLRGEAAGTWRKADREFRHVGAFRFFGAIVLFIDDSVEGNGCFQFFDRAGEYLNAWCGSESSEWNWEIHG